MHLSRAFHQLSQVFQNRHLIHRLWRDYRQFNEGAAESLWGSVTDQEETVLRRLLQEASQFPGPIIEVGTLFGLTTQLLAAAKEPDRRLITIDNYSWNPFSISPAHHRIFTHRALRTCMQHCHVEIFDGDNTSFYREYRGERPSMIFIDALHTYEGVKVDIAWAVSQQIPVICGHDYARRWPGVMRAVDEAFGSHKKVSSSIWSRVQAPPREPAASATREHASGYSR